MKRLLYLGFSFPPGVQALFPGVNPAGHGLETQMVQALREHFEIKSATILPRAVAPPPGADPSSGINHELILEEKAPEIFYRWRSLAQLKEAYRKWTRAGFTPDAVLVYNLSPIYNQFIRWLRRQPGRPKLVLMLLDSSQLGRKWSTGKRLRYRFKPFATLDEDMLECFDGCIGLSRSAEKYFLARNIPFLWVPGGCLPKRSAIAPDAGAAPEAGRAVDFAYFGALAPHSGIQPLVETFLRSPLKTRLHVCGFGQLEALVKEAAARDPRVVFHGLLSQDDCLHAAREWDVLVNPRPADYGNENNFPSKIFEYALCGCAILTTRMAGVEIVLGNEATYIDPQELEPGLAREMEALSQIPRAELKRRGQALRQRVTEEYSWARQAALMAAFMEKIIR